MKNLIKLCIFVGILLLASCAKEEMDICIDHQGQQIPCSQENQTTCLDEFGQKIECIKIGDMYYTKSGAPKNSAKFTRSSAIPAGENLWNLEVCQTQRQTYIAQDGVTYVDIISGVSTSHVQITDLGMVDHLQQHNGALFDVIVNENNVVQSLKPYNGPAGTPCSNATGWAGQ